MSQATTNPKQTGLRTKVTLDEKRLGKYGPGNTGHFAQVPSIRAGKNYPKGEGEEEGVTIYEYRISLFHKHEL